jgi:hypothetical protein
MSTLLKGKNMKYWIESKWEAELVYPDTIEGFHAIGKTTGADDVVLAKIQEAALVKNLFSMAPHPLDYLKKNSDGTTLLGFYQTDKAKALEWVTWRSQNLSPLQMYCRLVEEVEPGDLGYVAP